MPERTARMYLDKSEVDRSVEDLARERIRELFTRFDSIAVAFSGGKDSTVCLNLVAEEARAHGWARPIDLVFYDEEAIFHETEEYVRRAYLNNQDVYRIRWYCLPIRHLNSTSPSHAWWFCWDPDQVEKWCRPLPPEAIITPEQEEAVPGLPPLEVWHGFPTRPVERRPQIADYAPALFPVEEYGQTAYVMGIRADESMTRLRAVTRRKRDNWLVPYGGDFAYGNVTKAYPIYDWRTTDVWRAPAEFGWDYNRAYDLQELHGFHGARQRIAPPFGAEPMQMLGMYATCAPELWDRMVERVPGAATAARYARTELYSFRGRPAPQPGETWKELVNRLLSRHAEDIEIKVRARLADEIDWHYNKTRNPILPTAPHPVTGMSWEWLSMIAMRGDVKKRKTAGWELGENTPENRARIEAAYRAEHEAIYGANRQKEVIG